MHRTFVFGITRDSANDNLLMILGGARGTEGQRREELHAVVATITLERAMRLYEEKRQWRESRLST